MSKIDLAKYVARIEADTSGLNTGLDSADGLLKGKIGGMVNWSKLAIGGMIAGVVAGVGVTMKKGIESFVEFENEMNKVYTLLPDITDKAMGEMEQQVKDLSKEMGILPDTLIPALYSSLSASVPQENVFDFLEVASKGAIAGAVDTETVVDGLTSVLNAYAMEAGEAGNVSDVMFQTIKFGKTSMEELSSSLYNVIPTASSLGVSFEDVGAGLATITAQGTPTATATVQLRQMFVELSKEGSKTADTFQQLSGESFKDFVASGGNVQDALQILEQHANDTGVGINDLFSSVTAGNAALQLTGESTEMFTGNLAEMADSAGATDGAFETMEQGIGRSWERIKVGMSLMVLELGEKLAPAVKAAVDYIEDAMPMIQATIEVVFEVIGEVVKTFVTVIEWLVENITQFVADNEELFNSVKETISATFDGIIEIVNAFVELFKTVWDKWGKDISEFAKKHFDAVKTIIDGVLKVITGIVQAFTALLTGDWDKFGKALGTIIDGAWKVISGLFKQHINLVSGIFNGAISLLSGIAKNIMEGVHNAFKSVWETITRWIDNSFSGLGRTVSGFASSFYNAGRDIFSSLWDGLKSVWSGIQSWVSDKVSWISDKLKFWERSSDKMDDSRVGNSRSTPSPRGVASYDVGTRFVPMDGLAYLHKGEKIIPASQQGEPYGSGGDNNFYDTYEIKLEVKGNMDRSILPEVEKMITKGINKAQESKISKYKDVGIRRPVY